MEAVAQPAGRARALQALRSRDFRLLWSGQTISLLGDGAFLVALGWKSYSLTGSKSTLALVLMGHGAAMLTTLLIGGALADRYPRRTLMVVSDVARLSVMVALAAVDLAGELNLGLLIALAVCYGLGDGFFYPAFGGIVPLVVDQHHVASANALIGLSRQGAFVAGPALASALRPGRLGVRLRLQRRQLPRRRRADARRPTTLVRARAAQGDAPRDRRRDPLRRRRPLALDQHLPRRLHPDDRHGALHGPPAGLRPGAVRTWRRRLRRAVHAAIARDGAGQHLLRAAEPAPPSCGRHVPAVRAQRRLRGGDGAHALVRGGPAAGRPPRCLHRLRDRRVEHLDDAVRSESKLARVSSLDFFGSFALVPVGYALTAVLAPSFAPATLLVAGFGLSAVLWSAPLALRRVREAA